MTRVPDAVDLSTLRVGVVLVKNPFQIQKADDPFGKLRQSTGKKTSVTLLLPRNAEGPVFVWTFGIVAKITDTTFFLVHNPNNRKAERLHEAGNRLYFFTMNGNAV